MIVDAQVAEFMQLSVTVNTTLFGPKFVQLKVVLLKLKLTILQLSLLLLFTAAALVDALPELFKNRLIFLHNAVGATLSCTKIVLETEAKVLPQKSVAAQVS